MSRLGSCKRVAQPCMASPPIYRYNLECSFWEDVLRFPWHFGLNHLPCRGTRKVKILRSREKSYSSLRAAALLWWRLVPNRYLMNESVNVWSILLCGLALKKPNKIIWLMENDSISLSQLSVHPSCSFSGTVSNKRIRWIGVVRWVLTDSLVGLVS